MKNILILLVCTFIFDVTNVFATRQHSREAVRATMVVDTLKIDKDKDKDKKRKVKRSQAGNEAADLLAPQKRACDGKSKKCAPKRK
jgi:hypothetical protein